MKWPSTAPPTAPIATIKKMIKTTSHKGILPKQVLRPDFSFHLFLVRRFERRLDINMGSLMEVEVGDNKVSLTDVAEFATCEGSWGIGERGTEDILAFCAETLTLGYFVYGGSCSVWPSGPIMSSASSPLGPNRLANCCRRPGKPILAISAEPASVSVSLSATVF